jgi:hypothetical protein
LCISHRACLAITIVIIRVFCPAAVPAAGGIFVIARRAAAAAGRRRGRISLGKAVRAPSGHDENYREDSQDCNRCDLAIMDFLQLYSSSHHWLHNPQVSVNIDIAFTYKNR